MCLVSKLTIGLYLTGPYDFGSYRMAELPAAVGAYEGTWSLKGDVGDGTYIAQTEKVARDLL